MVCETGGVCGVALAIALPKTTGRVNLVHV